MVGALDKLDKQDKQDKLDKKWDRGLQGDGGDTEGARVLADADAHPSGTGGGDEETQA